MKTTLILANFFRDYMYLTRYLNIQAEEIHEDNIRWNAQMAGVDMVQSTRQQGSQEVIYHYQTEYLLGDSRKYPYLSTGGIRILIPPPPFRNYINALPHVLAILKSSSLLPLRISIFYFNSLSLTPEVYQLSTGLEIATKLYNRIHS